MGKRKLGQSGLEISPLVFGGNVFGWTADEATSFKLLDRLVDQGINCIDTADVYSRWADGHQGGESETILGKWLRHSGKRQHVLIASKVGMDMGKGGKGLSPGHIRRAVDASLQRLQCERIDLYQSHLDDPYTPLEETLSTYAELIKAGKIGAIGASNYSAGRLREAAQISQRLGLPHYQTLQPLYNLYERAAYEQELEGVASELGLGVITYSGLASGFLTGKYRSAADLDRNAARGKKVQSYMTERGVTLLAELDEVAGHYGATTGQVALAWLIARPSVTAPIASVTSLEQLDELIGATQLQLSSEAIERLNRASAW